jgi:outer membrane protein TolC
MHAAKTTLTLTLAACLGWLAPAAQAAPPDLPAVIQAGYERYPQRTLGDAIHRQGDALRRQASSLLADDPAVTLRHENDAWTDSNGFRSWEGGLDLPLWLPGQRGRRGEVASATDLEADAVGRLQYWRVAGEIRDLLWSLGIAETELALARQAEDSAAVLENDVDKRFRAGELARTDLIMAQKETLARQSERVAAQAALDTLVQQYRTWTGLTELPVDIEETAAKTEQIAEDHPALAAAGLGVARARARRNQVQGEKRANPVLTLGGKSERPVSGASYDTSLTVELHVPLGTKSQAAVKTADAERDLTQASIELAGVKRDLDTGLQNARVERDTAGRSLQLAQRQQALAAEGLRLTQRAFELGESDLFTLLTARAQALSAQRDVRLRRLELGRATARYNQALGVIPE